eukprot:13010164-Heterocapsa_arctica.AAC.1
MAHFIEDWEEEQKSYDETAPPLPGWTLEAAQKAREDMEATADKMVKMMKRRAAPLWSVPAEVFCMLLKPGHRRKDLKKGVGLGAEGCGGAIMDKFKERLRMILTQ